MKIKRHLTAIKRYHYSRPIALAIKDGLITNETSVFDYGCGRGDDVQHLRKQHIIANGWDPYYFPSSIIQKAQVVNLGFVINVIEDPDERINTLQRAYRLAQNVLIVSARVDTTTNNVIKFSDGHLTSRGTFQKIFTQTEFFEYTKNTLKCKPCKASYGILYIFKNSEYLIHR